MPYDNIQWNLLDVALYSCTCPVATYISLDANGETLVVKSVQSEPPIWGWGALIGHSSNMYSTIAIKWYVRGNRACANWDIQTCVSSLEYSVHEHHGQGQSCRVAVPAAPEWCRNLRLLGAPAPQHFYKHKNLQFLNLHHRLVDYGVNIYCIQKSMSWAVNIYYCIVYMQY
jgi:hypothetical protein